MNIYKMNIYAIEHIVGCPEYRYTCVSQPLLLRSIEANPLLCQVKISRLRFAKTRNDKKSASLRILAFALRRLEMTNSPVLVISNPDDLCAGFRAFCPPSRIPLHGGIQERDVRRYFGGVPEVGMRNLTQGCMGNSDPRLREASAGGLRSLA